MLTVRHLQLRRCSAELRRQVAETVVADNRDDLSELRPGVRGLEGTGYIAARGDAAEDPFFTRESSCHLDRLVRTHLDYSVQDVEMQIVRNEAVADSIDAMRPPATSGQN